MDSGFIRRIKSEISRAERASASVLAEIDEELSSRPSAELWILRGDAIQLSDGDELDLDDAEESYFQALELDPNSAEAYESLGHFTFAILDDASASLEYFRRAIELGAGESANEGLREAEEEVAEERGLTEPAATGVLSAEGAVVRRCEVRSAGWRFALRTPHSRTQH